MRVRKIIAVDSARILLYAGQVGQVEVDSVKRVVVFLPPTMGDCVHHLATLRWLRDGLPGRRIVAVSSCLGLEVLRTWPVEGIEVWDRRSLYWKLVWGRFDLAIFPYVQNKLLRAARAAGIRRLVGVYGGKHDSWFAAGVERRSGEHQVLDLCGRLFGEFGVETGSAEYVVAPQLNRSKRGNRVAFVTGSSESVRNWPLARFREVAEWCSVSGYEVVNVGGRGEHGNLDPIAHLDTAGMLDMSGLAELLATCDLVVSCDTGPMHLAGVVGSPVIGIFGWQRSSESFPIGTGHILHGLEECGCAARSSGACTRNCIDATSVQDVIASIESILSRRA